MMERIELTELSAALRATGATSEIIEEIIGMVNMGKAEVVKSGDFVQLRIDGDKFFEIVPSGLKRVT